MTQTINSQAVPAGQKKILFEKPHTLQRIFFSICVIRAPTEWYESKVSFDDPLFRSYYVLDGPSRYFEAKGEGIFQGDVWVWNVSNVNLLYSLSEILV